MTHIDKVVLDFLSVNCYLIWDDKTMEGVIVDPGSSEQRIFSAVQQRGFTPKAVLLTHAHVDHIGRVPEVCAKYQIPVWIHPADLVIYNSSENALRPWAEAVKDLPEPLGGECPRCGLAFEVIHTPGHTPGGCCFYFPAESTILTGDTMFRGTYGRCDFPGGSLDQIMASIREKLLVLPPETKVLPGHEMNTTIGAESENY